MSAVSCTEHRRNSVPAVSYTGHRRDDGPDVLYVPDTPHVLSIRYTP
ncbi:hypothetical protein P0D75_13480 [Paraburkholderia sediminicola]